MGYSNWFKMVGTSPHRNGPSGMVMPQTSPRSDDEVFYVHTGPVPVDPTLIGPAPSRDDELQHLLTSSAVREMEYVLAERHATLSRRRLARRVGFALVFAGYVITATIAGANFVNAVTHTDQLVSVVACIVSALAGVAFASSMAAMLAARRRRRKELERAFAAYVRLRQNELERRAQGTSGTMPKGRFTRPQQVA